MTVFWLETSEAVRRLEAAAQAVVAERSDVIAVYLFGSLAEGRAVPGSDADVLILLERSERRWLDRPLEFYRYFVGCGIGVELFCYTREEAVHNPMARRARGGGIRLAGRNADS